MSDFIGSFIIISIFDNNYIRANGFNLFLCIDFWLCKTRILTGDDDIQQMPIDVKYAGDSFFEINCILSFYSAGSCLDRIFIYFNLAQKVCNLFWFLGVYWNKLLSVYELFDQEIIVEHV